MGQKHSERAVPDLPKAGDRTRLLIDTDAANEIDDLFAIALAVNSLDRFSIAGFVATHYAARSGPESTRESYVAIEKTLAAGGCSYPIVMGGDPLCYPGVAQESDGARFIIEEAQKATPEDRLLVLVLGAASNAASAILQKPEIAEQVTLMFHGRSETTWPERSTQFNIYGDVIACQTLLECNAPLIWFDTGTALTASMEETVTRLKPLGGLGEFLHNYRLKSASFQESTKGFFDLGDVAWLIDPSLCNNSVIDAPTLTRWMYFDHDNPNGQMRFVSDIDPHRTWELFYQRLSSPRGDTKEAV
jgi:inosine-uridine nucleoside N-ribohydrolase